MWFTGDRKVAEPREQDKEEEDVIKWERQQLRIQRLSTDYFSLEVRCFSRLAWWYLLVLGLICCCTLKDPAGNSV
jgi:hypothetical protein